MSQLTVDELISESYRIAAEHGWWDDPADDSIPTKLALASGELVGEALEEFRDGDLGAAIRYSEGGKPEGLVVEMADAIIRLCDLAGRKNMPLRQALIEKMRYNESRPYRHGGRAV